jgi:hypothetical protein
VQQKWEEAQIFQADAKDAATRKLDDKFLATFPYPYSQSPSAQSDATRRAAERGSADPAVAAVKAVVVHGNGRTWAMQ